MTTFGPNFVRSCAKPLYRSKRHRWACAALAALASSMVSMGIDPPVRTVAATPAAGTIAALAGGHRCDGQAGPMAALGVFSLAVAPSGSVYFGDNGDWTVRTLNPYGVAETVVGTGYPGFSGDGGPAASARLGNHSPSAVTVDARGNLYLVDDGNERIRAVDASGAIHTILGDGTPADAPDGSVAATSATTLRSASLFGLDAAGNLFFQTSSLTVREVQASSGTLRTIALPAGEQVIAGTIDAAGNLYYRSGDNRIHKFTPGSASSIVVAGASGNPGYNGDGIPATQALLNGPQGIAVDSAGDIFISDTGNNRVRKVDTNGIITTLAGNGQAGYSGDRGPSVTASLNFPDSIGVDLNGDIIIGDSNNFRLRQVGADGTIRTIVGNGSLYCGSGVPAVTAGIEGPHAVLADRQGDVLFSDDLNNRIREISPGGIITTIAGNGSYWFAGDGGPATQAGIGYPEGLAIDAPGNIYVVDNSNNRIRKIDTSGTITTIAGVGNSACSFGGDGGPATLAQLCYPDSVAVDASGSVYFTDGGNARVRKVDPLGNISTVAGDGAQGYPGDGGMATQTPLGYVAGVTVGADQTLYLADSDASRVLHVDAAGRVATVAGNGIAGYTGDGGAAAAAELDGPSHVAFDTSGDMLIADAFNNAIRVVDSHGVIQTAAGDGQYGPDGDGGPATQAALAYPTDVAVDASGNLLIADDGEYRIRRVLEQAGAILASIVAPVCSQASPANGAAKSAVLASMLSDPTLPAAVLQRRSASAFTTLAPGGVCTAGPGTPPVPSPGVPPVPVSAPPSVTAGTPLSDQLVYHNGDALHHPKLFAIFWFPSSHTPADVATYTNAAIRFLQYQSTNTAYEGVLAQYYETEETGSHVAIDYSQVQFGGAVYDSQDYPDGLFEEYADPKGYSCGSSCLAAPGQQAVIDAARSSIPGWGDPSGNLYLLFTGSGESICSDDIFPRDGLVHDLVADCSANGSVSFPYTPTNGFCAYHDSYSGDVAYAVMPYAELCQADSHYLTHGDAVVDGNTVLTGHEVAEAITDPFAQGWCRASGYTSFLGIGGCTNDEVADPCAELDQLSLGPANELFTIQKLWSNSADGCVG